MGTHGPKSSTLAFERLAASHVTSAAGDTLIAIALAGTLFFSVPTGEARTRVALYLLLTMAPFALLGPVIGPMIDRIRGAHRLAIILAGAGRAALAVFMTSTADTVLLYPAAFGVLVLSRAHSVARGALLPRVIPEGGPLVPANARLARLAVLGGAAVAGPGIAVQQLIGTAATLFFAAGVFALTATSAIALPRPRRDIEGGGGRLGVLSPRLRRALRVNTIIRGLGGFLLFLLAFGLKRLGVGAAGFGLVLAASGFGAFVGATIVPRLRRSNNEEWVMAVTLFVGGGAGLIASRDFGTDLAALVGATVGVMSNAGRLAFDALVQRHVPERARGRTFARSETQMQLAWVAGALVPVLIPIGIEAGLVVASGGFVASALWFLVSMGPHGRRRLSDDGA